MMSAVRRRYATPFLMLAGAMLLFGCSAHVSVSASKVDVAGEGHYRDNWRTDWTAVRRISLGVCNVGGTKQGCYDATRQMVAALSHFVSDSETTRVPDRYVTADSDVKAAVRTLIAGYQRRNQGIANNVNADFVGGNNQVGNGIVLLGKAYAEFPGDAQPSPAP